MAFGHGAAQRWVPAFACAHVAGAVTGDVTEDAAEGAQAAPAGLRGDLRDRQVGVTQQRHGPFNAAAQQVAVRRQPECLLERTREMRRGYGTHFGQAGHRPVLVAGMVHPVLGTQQASQQFGALLHAVTVRAR
ncbi:hypothetical protein A7X84_00905 [Stenotrophomonas maltophilia]|nr:hypothetical protein A7X84_00905 [Stenotrophomonas maltophilia]